jgi:hypothetical protein
MDNKQYLGKNGGDRSRSPPSEKCLEGNWRSPSSDAGTGERQAEPADLSVKPRSRSTQLSTPPSRGKYQSSRSPPRHDSSQESRHKTTQLPSPSAQDNVRVGDILWLPQMETGQGSPSKLLRTQPWVNGEAPEHYMLVWDVCVKKDDELITRCLPLTSFNKKPVESKYNHGGNAWKYRLQYVPIQRGQAPTASSVNMPSLGMKDGKSMRHLTYVHLDHYFDIEAKFLEPSPGWQLTNAALCVVTCLLEEFVTDKIWRPRFNPKGEVISPLDMGDRLDFTPGAKSRSLEGSVLEDERLRSTGGRKWTGYEKRGPDHY